MKPFDENACCPKCKGSNIRSIWSPYDERRWLHKAFPEVTIKDEHILRVCQRCHYEWAEAPLDAEQVVADAIREGGKGD